ncbi:MAG: DUF4249 family protein [Ignavibacteriales bacterium]|nr:DUF4249 family protein [Ignavibacteriales bacterium]
MLKRKIFLVLEIIILSLVITSCEEDFNPKESLKDKNVLYCIIEFEQRFLPTGANVILTKLYDLPGYKPLQKIHELPPIPNAEVSITVAQLNFKCRQIITLQGSNTEPYLPQIYYRQSKSFGFSQNANLQINAVLPDGKILEAKTKIPSLKGFEYSYPFVHGITTLIDQWRWGKSWIISWDAKEGNLFFPKLILSYSIIKDSVEDFHFKEIPMRYIKNAQGNQPVYPSNTREPSISYDFAAIDSAMAQISAGDPNKSNYIIREVNFTLLEFDQNLSNYYSSVNGYMDNYSIRLDESVFTNISGGIGIFGTSLLNRQVFVVERAYVQSFGYKRK